MIPDLQALGDGNRRQQAAYKALADLRIFETLTAYNPVLSGTIPIAMDVAGSDLDVLCEVYEFDRFLGALEAAFGGRPEFTLSRGGDWLTASFSHGGFDIEIFGQSLPVVEQSAYRHMMIQARLLNLGGEGFHRAIMDLRHSGLKTEPAFARHLGITGDPYVTLLELEALDDDGMRRLLDDPAEAHGG